MQKGFWDNVLDPGEVWFWVLLPISLLIYLIAEILDWFQPSA